MLDFDNGATSKIDDVLTEHGGLLHVLPLAVNLCQDIENKETSLKMSLSHFNGKYFVSFI